MVLDSLNRAVSQVPIAGRLPEWSAAVVLPLAILLVYAIVSRLLPFVFPRSRRGGVRLLIRRTRLPIDIILIAAVAERSLQVVYRAEEIAPITERALPIVVIVAVVILVHRIVSTMFLLLRRRFDVSAEDNLKARRAHTQILVLERVVTFIVVLIGIGAGLMTLPGVRQYGTSLLASAGVAGLVVGFAAQQTIANVLAGIQVAITQPFRFEDAVVIDGEWGWIEEITLTYIVVRLWDKRRQVVPISYLLQKPFQNWTRSSSSIMGSVYIHADFTLDVDRLRAEHSRVLAGSDLWDGNVDVVQVVDTTERTMVLRTLVSAASSPKAWDLRCLVREALITWIRENQPEALPRERMRIQGAIRPARTS